MELYDNEFEKEYDFKYMNFNTFLNSIIMFFIVSINNNWPILANLSVISNKRNIQLMKFVFVLFKVLVNYILLNSLIAFIIEIFYEYEKKNRLKHS